MVPNGLTNCPWKIPIPFPTFAPDTLTVDELEEDVVVEVVEELDEELVDVFDEEEEAASVIWPRPSVLTRAVSNIGIEHPIRLFVHSYYGLISRII